MVGLNNGSDGLVNEGKDVATEKHEGGNVEAVVMLREGFRWMN